MVASAGCDANNEDDRCEVFGTCDADKQLAVSLIESRTRLPANVSILFKVDTQDGVAMPVLTPTNFDIFENDNLVSRFEAKQNILPKTGQFKYSIVLLLDLSGSIVGSESLESLKAAAQSFVDAIMFPGDDPRYGEIEMGIMWFDGQDTISSLVPFTVNPTSLSEGIASITPDITVDNSTNLYGAVIQGMNLVEQRLVSSTNQSVISAGSVVLFTDGTDQANRESRSAALQAVNRASQDVSVYSIGLSGETDPETLTQIGTSGFVSALNINDLVPRFQEIADLVRSEANSYYLLEYCSPKRNGENELTIRVVSGEYIGVLSTRFSARNFGSGCSIVD
jgi:uncharacterized protein YegL